MLDIVLLCNWECRSFRAAHASLSALFMDKSETDDLHLVLVGPLKGSALEAGYLAGNASMTSKI